METSSARAALEKMTDQELIKAFLDLGPQFSELEKMFLDVENKRNTLTSEEQDQEAQD